MYVSGGLWVARELFIAPAYLFDISCKQCKRIVYLFKNQHVYLVSDAGALCLLKLLCL